MRVHLSRFILVVAALLGGCTDLQDYVGTWRGGIVANSDLRRGFDADAEMTVDVTAIDRTRLGGLLTITPSTGGIAAFDRALLEPVDEATRDVLGDLSFDGDPVATYLFFSRPVNPAEDAALVVISAHPGQKLEVRVLREDLYGIFKLSK